MQLAFGAAVGEGVLGSRAGRKAVIREGVLGGIDDDESG